MNSKAKAILTFTAFTTSVAVYFGFVGLDKARMEQYYNIYTWYFLAFALFLWLQQCFKLLPAPAEISQRFSRHLIYADSGRASIAPEKLLRAMLVQVLFSVRSERQLMEQVRYNLLYRWFIGLAIDDEVWDHSSFSKNRERLLEHAVVESFFTEVMALAVSGLPIIPSCGRRIFPTHQRQGANDGSGNGRWSGRWA